MRMIWFRQVNLTHSPVAAMLQLREEEGIASQQVKGIQVKVNQGDFSYRVER
jgi:hypothetical protein